VVGQVEGALICAINESTPVEAKTFNSAATTFLVVKNMQHMYGILLSTHCFQSWDTRPDPVTELLEYRFFLRTKDIE
jgi:hypothetical protein